MNELITQELAKEYALVTTFIIESELLNVSIIQVFDESYELAKKFVEEYPLDTNWEEMELNYDEYIEEFIKRIRYGMVK
jgi:hypothetical protein